ncbi:MAG TPA: co-chaperone GroES family protein [Williamwhitmania sp.]|nr:co-chaperone GroES family protein [Williamwhitmania sp.]
MVDVSNLDKLIVVGDRVLVKPKTPQDRTKSGLFLPPGVEEKQKVQSGYVVKVGPGYPIPTMNEADESWKKSDGASYFPLQAKPGDLAVFIQDNTYEVEFKSEKYLIVPQNAILLLLRDEGLFE